MLARIPGACRLARRRLGRDAVPGHAGALPPSADRGATTISATIATAIKGDLPEHRRSRFGAGSGSFTGACIGKTRALWLRVDRVASDDRRAHGRDGSRRARARGRGARGRRARARRPGDGARRRRPGVSRLHRREAQGGDGGGHRRARRAAAGGHERGARPRARRSAQSRRGGRRDPRPASPAVAHERDEGDVRRLAGEGRRRVPPVQRRQPLPRDPDPRPGDAVRAAWSCCAPTTSTRPARRRS